MSRYVTVLMTLGACMGLVGVGELSEGSLIGLNHMIVVGIAGVVFGWLVTRERFFPLILGETKWLLALLFCLFCGMVSAYLSDRMVGATVRDTLAVTLGTCFGLFGIVLFSYGEMMIFWRTLLWVSAVNFALLLVALPLDEVPGMNVWFGDRFIGLSRNPNQTAFFASVGLIAAVVCYREARRLRTAGVWPAAVIGLGNVAVGLMTRSSASRFALPLFVAAVVLGFAFSGGKQSRRLWSALVSLLGLGIGIGVLWTVGGRWDSAGEEGAFIRNSNQAAYRFLLWKESFTLIAEYPVFGRGGGASGGGFDNQLEFEGMEAHNTFLDLGIATGLTGLAIFLGGIARTLLQLWRGRLIWEASFILLILIFGCFHNLLRQPLFWLVIAAGDYWRTQVGKRKPPVVPGLFNLRAARPPAG